ncbi:Monothiol glutaredoxin-S1 [Capsicum annuum]|nr:Monothiol glutaredoxin-S1 [Capsicum annuum]KAF3637428.1 Monothiol glutaredoxin-S1 [Capsicum annuum]
MDMVMKLGASSAVVIFTKISCSISHSIETLIRSFGVNPTVYELDTHLNGKQLEKALIELGCQPSVPAIFIGKELFGDANEIMSLNLRGKLKQLLIGANAIWVGCPKSRPGFPSSSCSVPLNKDGFRPILRINVVERSFEGSLNSLGPSPRCSTVNDDLIDNDLNDYENGGDYPINMEDDSMHMKDFSSDSQHNEEDCGTASQPGQSFSNGTNFCCGQTFTDKKELKILLDAAVARQSFDYYMEKKCTKLINVKCLSRGYGWLLWEKKHETLNRFRIYKGVMLSAVAHDTENHIFPIAFYVVDKENNASWTLFFQKLKSIVEDEPNLCVISDRHISIANAFSHSRAHFTGNRYDMMTTNIAESVNSILMDEREYPVSYIFNSIARKFGEKFRERHTFVDGKENIFVPYAERILRDNKSVRDSLYVSNPNGVLDQYTVFGNGVTAKVNLLKRSCSCQKFDLVKMYEHAMAALRTKYGDGEGYGNFV